MMKTVLTLNTEVASNNCNKGKFPADFLHTTDQPNMVYQYFIVLLDNWVSRIIFLWLPAGTSLSYPQCQSQGFCLLRWATSHTRTSQRWKQLDKEMEVIFLKISSLPLPQTQLVFFICYKSSENAGTAQYYLLLLLITHNLGLFKSHIWFKFSSKLHVDTLTSGLKTLADVVLEIFLLPDDHRQLSERVWAGETCSLHSQWYLRQILSYTPYL